MDISHSWMTVKTERKIVFVIGFRKIPKCDSIQSNERQNFNSNSSHYRFCVGIQAKTFQSWLKKSNKRQQMRMFSVWNWKFSMACNNTFGIYRSISQIIVSVGGLKNMWNFCTYILNKAINDIHTHIYTHIHIVFK